MKKFILILPIITLLAIGCNKTKVETAQDQPKRIQTTASFTNTAGGYIFDHPTAWKVVINETNQANTLFGPEATGTSGIGGVEVSPKQTSIPGFMAATEATYSEKAEVTVDGVFGVKAKFQSAAGTGQSVTVLRNGTIYTIYIRSENPTDIEYFNKLLESWKFTK